MLTRVLKVTAFSPLAILLVLSGCATTNSTESSQTTSQQKSTSSDSSDKLTEQEQKQVKSFLKQHIDQNTDSNGLYSIPDHPDYPDATGEFAAFHTVHQKDDGTYYVCVDFKAEGSDTIYDVDYFVTQQTDGMSIDRKFLHKVGDKVVQKR